MTNQQRQEQLDELKWKLSEEKGYDCCGEFDYCKSCDKDIEFPCAAAYEKFGVKSAEKKTAKAATATKPAAAKPATTAAKKPTAKKTTK